MNLRADWLELPIDWLELPIDWMELGLPRSVATSDWLVLRLPLCVATSMDVSEMPRVGDLGAKGGRSKLPEAAS